MTHDFASDSDTFLPPLSIVISTTRMISHSPSVTMTHFRMIWSLTFLCWLAAPQATALAHNSIKIVGIPGGAGTQLLPESYVRSFDRWNLDDDGNLSKRQEKCDVAGISSSSLIRPTLDFLIKGGVPVYVMAGLEVRENLDDPTSRPLLAHQWTTFAMAVEPNFRFSVFAGPGDGTDDQLAHAGNEAVKEILERLGFLLSQSTSADDFTDGFHILSIPAGSEWIKLPSDQFETLTCVSTAEPDARELLTLDEDLIEMTASSVLQVKLSGVTSFL
jgi:hypothetical protein